MLFRSDSRQKSSSRLAKVRFGVDLHLIGRLLDEQTGQLTEEVGCRIFYCAWTIEMIG